MDQHCFGNYILDGQIARRYRAPFYHGRAHGQKRYAERRAVRQEVGKPNWQNRTLFEGDNLDFLRAMNSDCVDLIATDPPFNKSKDFHATPERGSEKVGFHDRWSWGTDLRYSKTDAVTFNVDPVRIPYSEESAERLEYKAKAFRGDKTYDAYEPHPDGKHPEDWWPIQPLSSSDPERYGYPTQKPLRLYERIILASSNPGDMVLDPFCGCATTPVCAEKHGRQWAGIDIWENARTAVVDRLVANGLLRPGDAGDRRGGDLFAEGQLHHVTVPPARTDHGKAAAAAFRTKVVIPEPPGTRMTRAEMYARLLDQHGMKCQGCDRTFDDPRYLELDHNTPRADGGVNHISNRVLLCGPCNRLKSNIYTLSGLRRENTKRGYMAA